MRRKTINQINVFYYLAVALLIIWGRWAMPAAWSVVRWVLIAISVLFLGAVIAFSKCPHCGKSLPPGMKGNECPYCHHHLD